MATIKKKISTLVERQLPEFISSEYPKFASFLRKYYEQLELAGQPLDIIQNLSKYNDIDTYENNLLSENSILSSNITPTATTIPVADTYAFPKENGYLLIDDEVIFYASKTDTSFVNCKRNVSGNMKLGDLYTISSFKNVPSEEYGNGAEHLQGARVNNISNLFLYAFVKNFESQYLASFPEESLKPEVDKRTLIKNIKSFYRSKGTEQSIKFIFNSIVAQDPNDIPSIYYPKENTLKTSTSDWIDKYGLKVKILAGNPFDIIGEKIYQSEDEFNTNRKSAFAYVDNVVFVGNYGGDSIYEVIIAPETIVGEFYLAQKTVLTESLTANQTAGQKINVYSTLGWKNTNGRLLIGNEIISFSDKNVNQFVIASRGGANTYPVGTQVYNYSNLRVDYTKDGINQSTVMLPLGVLYNLSVESSLPYSSEGEVIQIGQTGFESRSPVIYDKSLSKVRWLLNETQQKSSIPSLNTSLINVSAIYEDSQYYYIASSGFPSYTIGNFNNVTYNDQRFLKLLKKESVKTTELNYTSTRDIGIFVNGVPAYGYKDYDSNDVIFGGLTNVTITEKGTGYKNPPYVLVSGDKEADVRAVLSGEVVERVEIRNPGEKFESDPTITITSGRGAKVSAIVTKDQVTKLVIDDPGEYYSTPPIIRIVDLANVGRLAEYTSIISTDGKLIGFNKIQEGKFYTQDNVRVDVIPIGGGATATAKVKRWKKNRYQNIQVDNQNGYYFENLQKSLGYGYAHVANPVGLRSLLLDNNQNNHSPILGFAYDGNPIYGPYGYSDATNPNSSIKRMETSYRLKTSRVSGPSTSQYALGKFVEDFYYQHRYGDLDENNGRYCVTPDYPDGVYAYFVTIDSNSIPKFPYIIGDKFYSIPTESNYTTILNQNDIPSKAVRLRTQKTPANGFDAIATIETVKEGSVSSGVVYDSTPYFSAGASLFISNTGTSGKGAAVEIDSLQGKQISAIESLQTKALKFETTNPVYYFNQSIITQKNTNATGEVVGNIFSNNKFVLRNITGNFNTYDTLDSNIRVIDVLVDKQSYYTSGYSLILTSGKEATILRLKTNRLYTAYNPFANEDCISFPQTANGIVAGKIYFVKNATQNSFEISETLNGPIVSLSDTNSFGVVATSEEGRGEILETVADSNTVKLKVTSGNFFVKKQIPAGSGTYRSDYYLKGTLIDDTVGSKIIKLTELSKNISLYKITDKVALVKTSEAHNLTVGDKVSIDINPNDATTTTNIHVRKRIYQTVKLFTPTVDTSIDDSGIGSLKQLNAGADYAQSGSQVFTNVELIFADQTQCRDINGKVVEASLSYIGAPGAKGNAKATITVSNGSVGANGTVVTTKGYGYKAGDILTVSNTSLNRLSGSLSQSVLYLEVTHVGLGKNQTELFVTNIDNISVNDVLTINQENVKVTNVDASNKKLVIQRAFNNTIQKNHPNNSKISNDVSGYQFTLGRRLGNTAADPIISKYDISSQYLTVVFDTTQSLDTITKINFNTTFFDDGTPTKLVKVDSIVNDAEYRFEFSSTPTISTSWMKNPIIEIQKYYKYKFITSDPSMSGSYLEFSPSKNKNLLTVESRKGSAIPGSGNSSSSFVEVKIGFGAFSSFNNFSTKQESSFINFYYYDKSGIVNAEDSYLKVVEDPLQGDKIVDYVSPNYFAYLLDKNPAYDGTGNYSYTTKSLFATGKISTVKVSSGGKEYKKIPTVLGIKPAKNYECIPKINFDSDTGKIVSVSVIETGKSYSNPVAIIINSSGEIEERITCNIIKNLQGGISAILLKENNVIFDSKPFMYIAEGDVKVYLESKNIGQPKNIKVVMNGSGFYNDTSISSLYTSNQILTIKNYSQNAFVNGEIIKQYENGFLIAEGKITSDGFSNKLNFIKVGNVKGEFKKGLPIVGNLRNNSAILTDVFFSIFTPEIKSYYDNQGYFETDRGQPSQSSQKIADSHLYQDYSYVVKSKSPLNIWKKLVEQTVHPSGFKMFAEVLIDAQAPVRMPTDQKVTTSVSVIEIWNPKTNRITVESTKINVTTTTLSLSNVSQKRGVGTVLLTDFDTTEMIAYDFILQPAFDGHFDESGNIVGRKTFNMVVPNRGPLNSSNANNLIVSLDGVLQEPEKSYTISGSTITFSRAPLGPRISNNQLIEAQKFVGRSIRFKQDLYNNKYFKKIKNIDSLFDGKKTRFPLYYENGSNVVLDANENLIVSLDGVLQESKITPLIPATASYYINRSVIPNEIVFVDAPRKLNEDNRSKFFAFSVGKYERIKVDETLCDGVRKGPFLLQSVFNKKPISVDTDKCIAVFVDGVFQIRNRSYQIIGSDIYFSEAPRFGQKINILYIYGYDFENKLTFFNYENNRFFNLTEITLAGDNFSFKEFFEKSTVYQGSKVQEWEAVGQVVTYNQVPGQSTTKILIKQQNYPFSPLKDLKFSGLSRGLPDYVIPADKILSIGEFREDEDRNDLLFEDKAQWLYGTEIRPYYEKNIGIDDLIKIDGETEFRKITSLPEVLKKVGHNPDDLLAQNHSGNLGITSTNSMSSGVGLSVQANVINGKVESLSYKNKDYKLVFEELDTTKIIVPKIITGRLENTILKDQSIVILRNNSSITINNKTQTSTGIVNLSLPRSSAYGYYESPSLIFVPQPPRDSYGNIIGPVQGGGASGYVVVDKGEIIDIVLTSKGSGYVVPPKIYVTKGYDIVKANQNLVRFTTDLYLSPTIKSGESFTIIQQVTISPAPALTPSIETVSEVRSNLRLTQPTLIITPPPRMATMSDVRFELVKELASGIGQVVTVENTKTEVINILSGAPKVVTYVSHEIRKTQIIEFGCVELNANEGLNYTSIGKKGKFQQGKLSTNIFGKFEDIKFTDNGTAVDGNGTFLSAFTLQDLDLEWPNLTIGDFETYSDTSYIGQQYWNHGWHTMQYHGAILDSALTISSTIIYIKNTSRFPSSGKLLVGDEIISYSGKMNDRFTGVVRGIDNTIPQSHSAGDYLRSL